MARTGATDTHYIRAAIAGSISGTFSYELHRRRDSALIFCLGCYGPKLSDGAAVFWSLVTGVVGGLVGKGWYRNYQKTSDGYRTEFSHQS